MILRVLLLAAIITSLSPASVPTPVPATDDNYSSVLTLCDLVQNSDRYDRKMVSVRAYYLVGAEQAVLYDPQCRHGEFLTFVDFAKLKGKFSEKLKQLEKTDKRALVVFQGTFFGPEPVEIDPKLPQYIKDKLAGTKRRYGHMDSLETMIEVTAIKDVQKAPTETPH